MKEVIGENESEVKNIINEIEGGTESAILNDKINHIR